LFYSRSAAAAAANNNNIVLLIYFILKPYSKLRSDGLSRVMSLRKVKTDYYYTVLDVGPKTKSFLYRFTYGQLRGRSIQRVILFVSRLHFVSKLCVNEKWRFKVSILSSRRRCRILILNQAHYLLIKRFIFML